MNKIFVLVILCIALVASEKIKGVRRTRHIVKRQAGGGCLYEGNVYQQGQTWTVPCKYNCVCKDGTAGRYSCTEVCPHYDTLPDGCFMQQDPNNQCCQVPKCNFQPSGSGGGGVITGTSGSSGGMISGGGSGGMVSGTGTPVLTMGSGSGHSGSFMSGGSCHDTINNCANYGQAVCTDPQYTQWVKQNCAQYCNQCGGSSGGMISGGGSGGVVSGGGSGGVVSGGGSTHTGSGGGGDGGFSLHFGTGGSGGTGGTGPMVTCSDAVQNCAAYGKTVCSDPQYDQWVTKNCANYCNKCGSTGTMTGGTGTMTGGTGTMTGGTGMVPVLGPDGTYIGTGGSGISGGTYIGTGGSGYPGTGTGTGTSGGTYIGTGGSGTPRTGTGTGTSGGTIIGTGGSGISGSGGTGTSGETVYVPGGGIGGTGEGTGGTGTFTGTGSQGEGGIGGPGTFTGTGSQGGTMTGGTGTMTGGTGTMTGGGMCADAINNCANYGQGVCSDPTYTDWVSKNCQAYCHKCSSGTMTGGTMTGTGTGGTIYYPSGSGTGGGTMTGGTMTGTGTGGTMTGGTMTGTGTGTGTGSSGTSTGCVYKQSVYQQGQTWKDGCTYSCTCVDATTGKYTCTGLCVQWNLPSTCSLNPPGPGKCCQTPNCPANVQIQYPQGYVEQ
nr:putative per-hexamer repeat protein 5 isoform X11 [Crassostrea gigas]